MASSLQKSWGFSYFFLVGLWMLSDVVRLSHGSVSYFKPGEWTLAYATFYGDDTASDTMGGACGYGNLFNNGYGVDTAALSTVLFNNGYACGSCYQMKCVQSPWCNGASNDTNYGYGGSSGGAPTTITVTASNLCPPNWYEPSDAGGWCNPPREHFDLSKPAFEKLAFWKAGIIPVMYRRVPCPTEGGIRFYFQGNSYWLLVYVMNVGGAGDISQMWVKGSESNQWLAMSHNWGASYQAFAQLGGQSLSFKLKSYSTGEVLIVNNVAPTYWSIGSTYQATVNFKP